jgi:hypothetical protein
MGRDARAPWQLLRELAEVNVDLGAITHELERRGVDSFRESYRDVLSCIAAKKIELSVDREHVHV